MDASEAAGLLDGGAGAWSPDQANALEALEACAAIVVPSDAERRVERAIVLWGMVASVVRRDDAAVIVRAVVKALIVARLHCGAPLDVRLVQASKRALVEMQDAASLAMLAVERARRRARAS